MFKNILLLVFCFVFANVAFSQIHEQFEEIRTNKVVRVHTEENGTICIEHKPDEMYIISPYHYEDYENDTFYTRYFIRDKDMSFDSIYNVSKYGDMEADTFVDYYKSYSHYDSLSRLIKEETFLDNKHTSSDVCKYNEAGLLDTIIYYNVTTPSLFGPKTGDSLRLNYMVKYEYDSLGRNSKVIKLYHNKETRYFYDEQDELVEIQEFNGFSRNGCIVDSSVKHYTSITFEDDENGLLKVRKERDFSLKTDKELIGSETFNETHYEYLENGLLASETNKYFTIKNGRKTVNQKYETIYDYDFFTYDIYKPLDAENTKADTSNKIPVVENELTNLLNEFDWSAYPAYPTISVYHNLGESTLWVAKYAESDDDEKLEMFILGYHEKIEKKAFFGLGKKQIKERKNIYMAVGLDNVKMLYQLYFSGKIDELKSKLRALDKEIN